MHNIGVVAWDIYHFILKCIVVLFNLNDFKIWLFLITKTNDTDTHNYCINYKGILFQISALSKANETVRI